MICGREEDGVRCEKSPAPGRQGRCSTHYWRDYRASRRDELNANYKEWAKKRGPRRRLMTDDQKLACRLSDAARRARRNAVVVYEVTVRDFRRMERRQRGLCAYCEQRPKKPLHMDHIVPLFLGGHHAIGNLVLACEECNKLKAAMTLTQWRHAKKTGRYPAIPRDKHWGTPEWGEVF